jgi:hypothetical protein
MEQTTAMAILPSGSGTQLTVNVLQRGGELSVGKKQLSYVNCGPGYYNTDANNTQGYFDCVACDQGYTNSAVEAYTCSICAEGYYCSSTDSKSCEATVKGSSSSSGASTAADCSCPTAQVQFSGACLLTNTPSACAASITSDHTSSLVMLADAKPSNIFSTGDKLAVTAQFAPRTC